MKLDTKNLRQNRTLKVLANQRNSELLAEARQQNLELRETLEMLQSESQTKSKVRLLSCNEGCTPVLSARPGAFFRKIKTKSS